MQVELVDEVQLDGLSDHAGAAHDHHAAVTGLRRCHLSLSDGVGEIRDEGETQTELDGQTDVVSGPYWWEGPDFTKRHELYSPQTTFKLKEGDGTEKVLPGFEGGFGKKNAYSTDNFFAFVHDVDGDGWNDVLTYGLPHTPAYLYVNPAGREQSWVRHTVLDEVT